MAFARPTYDALVIRVTGDMRAQLLASGKSATFLRRTKMWVLARVYAAIYHVLYGVLEWLSLQILPSTATDIDYLIAFGEAYGIIRLAATKSNGVVRFTGTNTTVVPLGTEFVREDGRVYVTTAAGTITAGIADITAESDVAGADTKMDAGTVLTLSSPIVGIDSAITWVSGFATGTDIEEMEALRTRILARMRATPHGGSADDYDLWAREVVGVFRVLVVALARGAGTVDVYFLHTGGTPPGMIPTVGQVTTVQTYLDTVRPVTANVLAKAPTTVVVNVVLGSLTPDTAPVRAAIVAELNSMFLANALTAAGLSIQPSSFYTAIAAAAGVVGFDLNSPAAAVTCVTGQVLVLGTLT